MKIEWNTVIAILIALVVFKLVDTFVLSKIESYDEMGSYEGEEYQ